MINLNIAFILQIVNVLALLAILHFLLFKPVRKIMADRQSEIDGDSGKASSLDREVQEKVALYEARLKEVKARASEEKGNLIKQARQEEASVLEKARAEANDMLSTIKNKVAKEAADAKALLKEQARSLSREITEKVLGRSLS